MIVPLLLLGLAASSPVDRPARQTSMVLVRAGEGQRIESRQSSVEDIRVPAGEAVDIFYRYGFFSLSVRVVPRDDHGSWLIREPTFEKRERTYGEEPRWRRQGDAGPCFEKKLILTRKLRYGKGTLHEVAFSL